MGCVDTLASVRKMEREGEKLPFWNQIPMTTLEWYKIRIVPPPWNTIKIKYKREWQQRGKLFSHVRKAITCSRTSVTIPHEAVHSCPQYNQVQLEWSGLFNKSEAKAKLANIYKAFSEPSAIAWLHEISFFFFLAPPVWPLLKPSFETPKESNFSHSLPSLWLVWSNTPLLFYCSSSLLI